MQGTRIGRTAKDRRPGCARAFGLFFFAAAWLPAAPAEVFVSLQPDTLCVAPLETFDLVLTVDQEGSGFNGYEAVVRFDPARLTFVSVQEGALMRGLCGATWWRPVAGGDSIFFSHVALCGPDSLVGPGPLSSITFQARSATAVTEVFFDRIVFLYAGYEVPSISRDAVVVVTPGCPATGSCCFFDGTCQVLVPADCNALGGVFLHFLEGCLPDPCAAMSRGEAEGGVPRLRIVPNPSLGKIELLWALDAPGDVRIEICDSQGRLTRRLLAEEARPGSWVLPWEGCDETGRRVSAGAYFARIFVHGRMRAERLIVVE